MNKLIFYHISDQDLGQECLFRLNTIHYEDKFKSIPRICVAPTIKQCLMAIGGIRNNRDREEFYVYKILIDENDPSLDLITPQYVPDYNATKEAWILEPRYFTKHSILHRKSWGGYSHDTKSFVTYPTYSLTICFECGIITTNN